MLTRDELNALGAQILDACIEYNREDGETLFMFAARQTSLRSFFGVSKCLQYF